MKRHAVKLLLCLAFVALGVSTVQAQAVVSKEFGCFLLYRFPDGSFTVFPGEKSQTVVAGNPNGNISFICRGELPDSLPKPSRAVILDFDNTGFPCTTPPPPGTATVRWSETITPGGKATLTCHVGPNSTP